MADWAVSFIVKGKMLDGVMEAIHRFHVENLDMKLVVVKGAKGKAGGAPAWQVVAEFVQQAKHPVQAKEAGAALTAAGFNKSGVSTHLATGVKKKLIRKTKDGYVGAAK